MNSRYFFIILIIFLFSCSKEFLNPYDPATPPDIWMPKAFKLDTLGTNTLRLSWSQEELHIDGFVIQKSTNGEIREILLPKDSIRYTDIQAVDTSSNEVCPELSYKVMARAGNNRSLDIGTTSGIRMPLSTPANAGEDILIIDSSTQVVLNASPLYFGNLGLWSIVSGEGGSFVDSSQSTTTFIGQGCTEYVLKWTVSNECDTTMDFVSVKFKNFATLANAGADQTLANGILQATLSANAPQVDEFGTWMVLSGDGGYFSNPNSPTASFIGEVGQMYVLQWSISACEVISTDQMILIFPLFIEGDGVVDFDGNLYQTQIIGTQEWMAENLKSSSYCNGELIPNITDGSQWSNLTFGAWCNYENVVSNNSNYGKLYNWYSISDPRNICPCGWHVPSDSEWGVLINYLGGSSLAGGKMKVTGNSIWNSPNVGATNESGFSALPGGYCDSLSLFYNLGYSGNWWSSTEVFSQWGISNAWFRSISYDYSSAYRNATSIKNGFSVRCIRD
jgi:uncharacterized protein (TIGR02145 family)